MNTVNTLDDDDVVSFPLEDGSEVDCPIIAIFPYDEKRYIMLQAPKAFDDVEKGDYLLFGYDEDENGDPFLVDIESEEEYDAAYDAFEELIDEEAYNELMADE